MRGEERPIMEVTEAINLTAPLIQDDWPCLSSLLRRAQERIFELEEENKRLNGDPVPVTCQTSSAISFIARPAGNVWDKSVEADLFGRWNESVDNPIYLSDVMSWLGCKDGTPYQFTIKATTISGGK